MFNRSGAAVPSDRDFRVFISAVSSEAGTARDEIASDLSARGLLVRVQRDFRQEADTDTTLAKLDRYIRDCAAVVHVAAARSGAFPRPEEAAPYRHMLPAGIDRASYTQWEFHMARHHGRRLSIYIAGPDYAPDRPAPTSTDEDGAAQAAHVGRLERLDRDYFGTVHELCRKVLREHWPHRAPRRPHNLPFTTLGDLFKGRGADLDRLRAALTGGTRTAAVAGKALHGLGGVGKTRLSVEYALLYEWQHAASLFLRAETPERLNASLVALAGSEILDLPEKDAARDDVKVPAVLRWLEDHPGWLMILDNVDDDAAVRGVDMLLPRLRGGSVLITGRTTRFPASVRTLELGTLDEDAATAFLLERTRDARDPRATDDADAQTLAKELGGLALGLQQAGAYVAARHVSLRRYLDLWREKRETVLGWFDPVLMSYDHDTGLAAVWATSVEQLTPEGRRLLERLAFLAPEPVPDALFDWDAPGEAPDFDARAARGDLLSYSLAARALSDGGATAGVVVHRLVQDYTRRGMTVARRAEALREALEWIDAAFMGDPGDVRTWPHFEPLAAHALAVVEAGDQAKIAHPTVRIYGRLDQLYDAKARYAEAEHASRRALAIEEVYSGVDHSLYATRLSNLAVLLRTTNRFAEAEPLMRQALAIDEASLAPDHPILAVRLNNLAVLLETTNRLAEAEPLMRRALAIYEVSLGPDHPTVATCLNNIVVLLKSAGRPEEAEPLIRRALEIDEAGFGPDHPTVALRLSNLAALLQGLDRAGEAEPLVRRALSIDERSFGPDHPHVAVRLSNLAALLHATDRQEEAEPLIRRALSIDERSFGPGHPKVAIRLSNLAGLLSVTGRSSEAEPLLRRALAIDEASYGPDHPTTRTIRHNLFILLQESRPMPQGRPQVAPPTPERAASVACRLFTLAGRIFGRRP